MTPQTQNAANGQPTTTHRGFVHCPMCTHNVDAEVVRRGRETFVKPAQKCPRCSGSLDAAYILEFDRAA